MFKNNEFISKEVLAQIFDTSKLFPYSLEIKKGKVQKSCNPSIPAIPILVVDIDIQDSSIRASSGKNFLTPITPALHTIFSILIQEKPENRSIFVSCKGNKARITFKDGLYISSIAAECRTEDIKALFHI